MLWKFFTLKFINGEWWQQKKTNLQNNINITFLILIRLFQKQTNRTLKIYLKSNEKESEKTGAGCYTSLFTISFLFVGKKDKNSP